MYVMCGNMCYVGGMCMMLCVEPVLYASCVGICALCVYIYVGVCSSICKVCKHFILRQE